MTELESGQSGMVSNEPVVPGSDFPGDRLLPSLLRIAETALTVGDLAETDLWYVEPEWSAIEAHERLVKQDFDYAPVRESRPHRYVARVALEDKRGTVDDEARTIDAAHLVTSTLGLAAGISILQPEGFYFVLTGDRLSGIVTYADVQKAPVSMVTLALILAAEVGVSRLIAGWMPETWRDFLSEKQRADAQSVFDQRRQHNTEIGPLECLTLPIRLQLLLKHPILRAEFFPGTRGEFNRWQETLLNLRNTLAHGGTIFGAESDPVRAIDLFNEVRDFAERVWQFPAAPTAVSAVGGLLPPKDLSRSVPRRELVRQRVVELSSGFDSYVAAYDRLVPFTMEQLAAHRHTIALRTQAGPVADAIHNDDFLRSLHETLLAWGLGTRGSHLAPLSEFSAAIRAVAPGLEELESLSIDDLASPGEVTERVWRAIEGVNIVENKAKIVAGTKALHHLLPQLIIPMDRMWTGMFFQLHSPEWQGIAGSSQQTVFVRSFRSLIEVASTVEPQRYVTGEGWRTSRTKIIDNALIGYCQLELLRKGTEESPR